MTTLPRALLVAFTLVASAFSFGASVANVATLAPAEAATRIHAGTAVLIDVREAAEWKSTGVVATAHLLALSDLRGPRVQWKSFLKENRGKELVLYCHSGARSAQAAQILAGEGFRVVNAGGLQDWIAAGIPTRKASEPPQAP